MGLYIIELGLSLITVLIVFFLPLTPIKQQYTYDKVDFISVPLMYAGISLFVVMTSVGESYWWFNQPWIGEGYALSFLFLALFTIVEYNRKRPYLKMSWIFTPQMLWLFVVLMIFRILMSAQSYGFSGFMSEVDEVREQLVPIYTVIAIAQTLGYVVVAVFWNEKTVRPMLFIGIILMVIGIWMNVDSTSLTRSYQFVVGQAILTFGGGVFMPAIFAYGIVQSVNTGGGIASIITYLMVFLTTQVTGDLIDTAFFGTFYTFRSNFHTSVIGQSLTPGNPLVIERLKQYAEPYAAVTADKSAISDEASKSFGSAISDQAAVLSYNDIFILLGVFGIISIFFLSYYFIFSGLSYAEFRQRLRIHHRYSTPDN